MAVLTILMTIAAVAVAVSPGVSQPQGRAVDNRHIFNPRMDYEEWKPLGRGDPLKNDPTYDYVPPVLDRVHYWMDPSKRTPDPPLPNAGVMVMSSRTELPTTTVPATSRLGTISLFDPFLKFMETSKATLGFSTPINYYRPTVTPTPFNPPTHSPFNPPTHHHPYLGPYAPQEPPRGQALQRPPYTMLMPPPPPTTEPPITSFGTTLKTTSEAEEEITTIVTTEEVTSSTASSTTPSALTTNLANSENLYKPVAINMPEAISNGTNEDMPTTGMPEPEEETLPIMSLFSENGNHINYHELKLPSLDMVPPPEKSNEFFDFRPTTVRTTTSRTLTTDPMFKHYKQPKEPMRGPFYLIIQGHSKVKTYGASKNKVKPYSSNEINYEDGKTREEEDDLISHESHRKERKLKFESDIDDEDAEIVEGHPTLELSASFQTKGQTAFRVSDNEPNLEALEEAFPKRKGGASKKRFLVDEIVNDTSRRRPGGRSLLSTTTSKEDKKDKPTLDKDLLSIESLIALSDDYDTGDILSLLNKQEGEGSGVSGFVSSLLARSQSTEEM